MVKIIDGPVLQATEKEEVNLDDVVMPEFEPLPVVKSEMPLPANIFSGLNSYQGATLNDYLPGIKVNQYSPNIKINEIKYNPKITYAAAAA